MVASKDKYHLTRYETNTPAEIPGDSEATVRISRMRYESPEVREVTEIRATICRGEFTVSRQRQKLVQRGKAGGQKCIDSVPNDVGSYSMLVDGKKV